MRRWLKGKGGGAARWRFLPAAVVLAGFVGAAAPAGAEPSPATVKLRFDQQTLAAEVGAAPLAQVLRAVAEETDMEIEIRGELGEVRPQAFEGVPLEEAMRRLVGDNRVNLIMRYEVDAAGGRRVVSVTVRAAGEVPADFLEQRRMRAELSRVRIPPPPPPPPPMQ